MYLDIGCIISQCLKLHSSLDSIVDWVDAWQLRISVDKCNILTVGDGPVSFNKIYSIDNYEIPSKP